MIKSVRFYKHFKSKITSKKDDLHKLENIFQLFVNINLKSNLLVYVLFNRFEIFQPKMTSKNSGFECQ